MPVNHDLTEITQPEAERILGERGLALLVTGSVEQHGPHLPFATDYYAALAIGRAVAPRVRGLLVSLGPLGVTPFHLSFAGTVSLRAETFMAVVRDVVESLMRHGANKFVILNWHEGNTAALSAVAGELQAAGKERFVIAQVCYLAWELGGRDTGLTHGGAVETLAMLACQPSLVHLDRAGNPSPPEEATRVDALRRGRAVSVLIGDIREVAPTGWYGDLSGVSAEKGQALLADVADVVVSRIEAVFGP